jgi:cytochrome c5
VAAAVTVIDTAAKQVAGQIMLPNGSTGVRGIVVSPDGAHVYVTHVLARYQVPTTQLERGWMNTSGLSILDAKSLTYINTVLLDDVDLGAANPWGVIVTPDGTNIFVTHAGTHEISVIDRTALHLKLKQVTEGKKVSNVSESAEDVPNDLSFLVGIRTRIGLPGNGPRCIAIGNNTIYVGEYFSDSLSVIPCNKISRNAVTSIALGPQQKADPVRQGELLFNDAMMCFQQWQSCASCHPDGRADGLNWDLLNDGLGNPKQTKSLLLSHETPPVMITGIRPDAETAVRAGMKYIQFIVRPDEDARAIDAYCKSMKPVPSPARADGKLSPAAQRGKNVYDRAKCSVCHPAPLFTDLKKYDVGLGTGREQGQVFDTPTLVEIWRTAPYLYDGRALTMKDVLTTYNTNNTHGITMNLTDDEINDLCEYILSL